MRKNCMFLWIMAFLLFGFINPVLAVTTDMYENSDTGYKVIIEDDANLLSYNEEQSLADSMEKLTEYGNIAFKSISKNGYGSASRYAEKYYHETFGKESGTVFLIDMSQRKIYIFSDGQNYKTITKSKAETITDNVYKHASNKEYFECADEAYSQMYTILEGGKIAEPMKYISNALIAVMLALFANFAIFKIATKNRAASVNEQIKECAFSCTHTNPSVRQTGEHRVYSPVSDSSSSGGSSGGGGGSSGGGGGHSF
ncbi:MAG: TPM domain-containing protein [Clostridia bacterium]|nr:TPM domain-containing protein [Clostridia bacterium]